MTWLELKTEIDEQLRKQGLDPDDDKIRIDYFDFNGMETRNSIMVYFDEEGLGLSVH